MARANRCDLPDGYYHVVTRGVAGAEVFRDDDDRRFFLRLLAAVVARDHWHCYAFCLMTTHYHLVVEATLARLSAGLQRLNGVHAQRFNRRHGRHGHLFGDRFHAWLIEDEDHLENTCEYVLQNPVRAGICKTAEDWPWSASRSR
jgi:putative transposase